MKGRISDTCSLPLLQACLRVFPLSESSPLPPCLAACAFNAWVCYWMESPDATKAGILLVFFLPLVSFPSDSAQNDNDCAATGCLPGAVPDTWIGCLPVCLYQPVLPALELVRHSLLSIYQAILQSCQDKEVQGCHYPSLLFKYPLLV